MSAIYRNYNNSQCRCGNYDFLSTLLSDIYGKNIFYARSVNNRLRYLF